MKPLQNKLTNEIGCLVCSFGKTPKVITVVQCVDGNRGSRVWYYNSLAELNEEWEDAPEEPKEYWYYDTTKNGVEKITHLEDKEKDQAIGNYFETKEEAEKAVEKLKAWKRLKDRGFRTYDICKSPTGFVIHFDVDWEHRGVMEDLDLLFSGEDS